MSSNDLLIILAVQVARGVSEGRESLAQICDLAELLRIQKPLDWEELLQQVNSLELERPFFISLLIVNTLLNTPY
ncbi:MAG: nucleotidyltransferase family protein [Nostoc sp. DedQUE12a]|nr:nucleotidyltransferase family protein [Nostoc sp. DedQUE12a]